jgi:hypothetical protein
MASGHVNRANRPNTWLLRPSLLREEIPCQPGAVHTWPNSEVTPFPCDVRYLGRSGRHDNERAGRPFDGEQRLRHRETERLGGLEVDCKLELGRLLNVALSRKRSPHSVPVRLK